MWSSHTEMWLGRTEMCSGNTEMQLGQTECGQVIPKCDGEVMLIHTMCLVLIVNGEQYEYVQFMSLACIGMVMASAGHC